MFLILVVMSLLDLTTVLIMLMVFLYCHDDMQTLNIHGLSRVPEVRLPTYDVWIMTGFQLSYMMH